MIDLSVPGPNQLVLQKRLGDISQEHDWDADSDRALIQEL